MVRFLVRLVIANALIAMSVFPAAAMDFSDAEIIRGFNLTVFGSEYSRTGFQTKFVHKFSGPVRFKIHDRARKNRAPDAARFISSLNGQIRGIDARVVDRGRADFDLFIVDRKDYKATVAREVSRINRTINSHCMVKSTFSRSGNIRSVAVIVSDRGDALFRRCLIEEVLQGLGPLNEHHTLSKSLFNDRSKHSTFTKFDRYILNMLYDPRIQNGKRPRQVQSVLPEVLADTRRRLK